MKIEDLFVSYKAVDPIKFKRYEIPSLTTPYLHIDRARKVTSSDIDQEPEVDYDWSVVSSDVNWKVQDKNSDNDKSEEKVVTSKWINPYANTSPEVWIQAMTEAYKTLKLSDNAIKNLLAKNVLESGWGKYAQGAYNFGNLTTGNRWKGAFVNGKDKDINGNQVSSKFRAYNNLQDFVKDEIQFLKDNYDFNPNDDFDTFMGKLQGANSNGRRYAAAPDYIDRVRRVYKKLYG